MSCKHVLLSGGTRGLGLELSRMLLASGYAVSAFGRTRSDAVQDLERTHSSSFVFFEADLSHLESVSPIVDQSVRRLGPLWALINNAAVGQEGVLATLPPADIHRIIAVNLEATILLTRAALRHLLRRHSGGRIINISSITGTRGYNGLAAYSATKAGLDGFTRAIAREVGRRQITVNSVAPGYMRTEMSASISQNQLEQIVRRTPMGRLAEPADVASIVRFLLSEDAAFITGTTILVDGGISS